MLYYIINFYNNNIDFVADLYLALSVLSALPYNNNNKQQQLRMQHGTMSRMIYTSCSERVCICNVSP